MGVSLPDRTLIKQPVNQDLRVENGVLQLTERWKGRYTWCQAVAKDMYSLNALDYNYFRTKAGTLSSEYTTPTPPTDYAWWFAQATVDECDAGENGFLQIIWNAMPANQFDGDFEDWPVSETWNLQWQPENYDVYAYCANLSAHQSGENGLSQRTAIEACLHPPLNNRVMTQNKLFSDDDGVVSKLNAHEQKILKWKLEGKYVIKHHPLLTQTKVWQNIPESKISMILDGVSGEVVDPDVMDTPDFQMNLVGYQWVSQGSNVQCQRPDAKKNEYSVYLNTSWVGALSGQITEEFYSNNPTKRWNFGQE